MDFKKIQLKATIKAPINATINQISIELSYPNSIGEYIWKSSGRLFNKLSMSFLKGKSRSGNEIDVVVPCSWIDFENDSKEFVFDFVKNENSNTIKIKQIVLFNDNKTEQMEYEIKDSEKYFETKYISFRIYEKNIGTD